jgi:hypothetical protein
VGKIQEGDYYDSVDLMKQAMYDQAVADGFEFRIHRRDKERFFLQCKNCEWECRSTWQKKLGRWKVNSVGTHNCAQ